MKLCCGCRKTKPKSDFGKNAGRRDGLQTQCKACMATRRNQSKNKQIESVIRYAVQLCDACNSRLRKCAEDIRILEATIQYTKKYNQEIERK